MNAPATAATLQATPAAAFHLIPLGKIEPSRSEIQRMRRERFTKESLDQLAASIRQVGVAEPVLLRPLAKDGFELVAGERRWMAARMAGLAEIPAMVRTYTDDQALELQLIENLQRVDLHEMEEAEGYDMLRKLKKLNADDIAAHVGKSRSHVFARLKLLDLSLPARKAFYAGNFEASVALLIARVPGADMQATVIKELTERRFNDSPITFRETQHMIQHHFMAELKGVGFQMNDAALLPAAGACTACPKRTGNQADLFTDIKNPNVCTDPPCLKRKTEAHQARVRAALAEKGETIIDGAQAKKIKPSQYSSRLNEGYILLDDEDQIGGKWQTWRKAIGKQPCPAVLLDDPHTGKLLPVAKREDVAAALKANGVRMTASRPASGGRDRSAEIKAQLETRVRLRILAQIRAASLSRQFVRDDTILCAQAFYERIGFDAQKRLVDAWNADAGTAKPKGHDYVRDFGEAIPELTDAQLGALFIDMALVGSCHCASYGSPDDGELLATAEACGIDVKAVRAEEAAAAKEKTTVKKKTAKK